MTVQRTYLRNWIAAFLLPVLLLLPSVSSSASAEQAGITVSRAPEPGWNPDLPVAEKGFFRTALIGAAVILILGACGILIFKKVSGRKPGLPGKPAEPEENKPSLKPAVPPPAARPAPVPPHVPVPPKPPVQPAPVQTPPPLPFVQKTVQAPVSPAAVQKASPPPAPRSEEKGDDLLLKHLDLLKQLKNKEDS
jgi:hypothetical protein